MKNTGIQFSFKSKRWSTKEEAVITEQVKKHPNNLQQAFRISAKKLGRTEYSCSKRWYGTILKRKNTAICFAIMGCKTKNINRKNVHTHTSNNTEYVKIKNWWNQLKKLIKL